MSKASKEIKVLSEHEHILQRPTIYVGSVKISDENVPIIKDAKLHVETRGISVGMYKLFDEVFSNSVDEAKRMKAKMKSIKISIDSKLNQMTVEDSGDGFINASKKNKKSGLTNVDTAMSMLRAGSNFDNDDIAESLIGTNGMGVSLVNALSESFLIQTINSKEIYSQEWKNFIPNTHSIKTKPSNKSKGTKVSFIPLSKVFDNCKWNREILYSILVLKKRVLETEEKTKDLSIILEWDGKKEIIKSDIYSEASYKTKIGEILIWENLYPGSASISFMNSASCTGIHQKIILDEINKYLEDSLGHHFYDFLFILNLPPSLVKFGDQNKTRFVTKREEVENIILSNFESKIRMFTKSNTFKKIQKKVEARRKDSMLKDIRKAKKQINIKYSKKYFPSTSTRPKNLFIVEGLSAAGSLLQERDPKIDGVYALKGKIKNARSIADLQNVEILELMKILNLDSESPLNITPYENIVIAADQDPDGAHITALVINLFYQWFPWIIKKNKLFFFETPLISIGDRVKRYFYSLDEFDKYKGKITNIRYLKGLGSLAEDDWESIMKNRRLINIKEDRKSKGLLEMAFGKSSQARKNWLSK